MNLYEFISYKNNCPICETPLITGFCHNRKQVIKYENDNLSITIDLDSLKKGQKSYKMTYLFGLHDNSFTGYFSDSYGKRFEDSSPLFLIDRAKNFNKNIRFFSFFRLCTFCNQYKYRTKKFLMDFSTARVPALSVYMEEISLLKKNNDNYLIYSLTNHYGDYYNNRFSRLFIWNGDAEEANLNSGDPPAEAKSIRLPLIQIMPKEKMMNKLDTIVLFS